MIAKIMKGSDFKGVVYYILNDEKGTQIIDSDGLFLENNDTIAQGFIGQAQMNPRVTKAVGHIALSFSKEDAPRLNNVVMTQIAREYMERMGIKDTQYIIGRHFDKEHPHVHIAFNRIDNNGKTISDRNDRFRSERICKELTKRHEKAMLTTFKEAVDFYEEQEPRGEYVLVVEGKSRKAIEAEEQAQWAQMSIADHVDLYISQGMDKKEAMKLVAKDRGVSKRDIYSALLD